MSKIIKFDREAILELKKGADILANAVKKTLGPKGHNVIIEKKFGGPQITKDGVTVAKEIDIKDPLQNIGARVLRNVASDTNDKAGDGTTTATVLAQAIINEGFKSVTAGVDAMSLKRGIDRGVETMVEALKKQSKKIETSDEVKQIATISANNDEEMGAKIAELINEVGADGAISVEEGRSTQAIETYKVEGMEFDQGYESHLFVTNNSKMEALLEDPVILLSDKKISAIQELIPVLEMVSKAGRPLFIIADGFEGSVITTLVINKIQGIVKVAAVKSPAFGDRKKAIMRDIATLTGGKVVGGEEGYTLANVQLNDLGRAKKVRIGKDQTTIVDGAGAQQDISARIKELSFQAENTDSEYDKSKLEERKAKLSGGVGVISVGGVSEMDAKERKDRVDDAVSATRAAIEEGVVPGGGVALLRAAVQLDQLIQKGKIENEDEKRGMMIVRNAAEAPIRTILENAKGRDYHPIFQEVKEKKADFGYNVRKETFGSLFAEGVIDPLKVTRLALEKAGSSGGLLLTTQCVIAEEPSAEEKSPMPGPMGGGMGGMM